MTGLVECGCYEHSYCMHAGLKPLEMQKANLQATNTADTKAKIAQRETAGSQGCELNVTDPPCEQKPVIVIRVCSYTWQPDR